MSTPNQNPNPNIANRKILTPRRRLLNRAASDTSSNPMQNFNFIPQTNIQTPGFGQPGQSQSQNVFNMSGSSGSGPANQFNTKSATSQPSFGFGASQGQNSTSGSGAFQFGGPSTQQTPAFTFGSSNTSSTTPSNQPTFSFGSQNSSSSTGSAPAAPQPFSFGAPADGTRAQAASPFGGLSASGPAPVTPQSPSTIGFNFGAPAQSSPVTPSFSFGQQSAAAAAAAPAPAPAPATGFTFNPPASAAPQASSTGLSATQSTSPAQQTGFTFGAPAAVSAPPPTSSAGSFTFGSAAPSSVKPTFGFPTPASVTATGSAEGKNGESPMVTETETNGDTSAMADGTPKESADAQQNVTKIPSFFGTGVATKSDAKDTTDAASNKGDSTKQLTFSFGAPTATPAITFGESQTSSNKEADKPKQPTFTFGATQATSGKEDDKSKQPTISFGTPQADLSKESDKPEKPAFSFGAPQTSSTGEGDKSKPPTFSFGGQTTSDKKTESPKPSGFTFGTTTPTTAEKQDDKPKQPTFSFGASTTSTSSEKPSPSITFNKPPSSEESGQQSKSVISLDSSATSKGEQPSKPLFSFSASATTTESEKQEGPKTSTAQVQTTPSKEGEKNSMPSFGFSVPSASPVQSEDGGASTTSTSNKRKNMESAASPEPRSKLLHGKSPLSQSWHAEDNDTNTTEKATKKRSTSTTEEETPAAKAASSTEEPKKKKTSGEDKETKVVNPFAALDSTPIEVSSLQTITAPSKSRSTSADVFGKPAAVETEQTMVNSSITGPETIAKRTRYTELPLEAQAEIDNLWQLISQQTSTCRTIQAKQLASNGEMIEDISRYTKRMALDVRLTKEQHQSTLKNVIRLRDNVEHELTNALVVKVYHETDDSRKWMTGQTATRQYFVDLINGMQARCIKYRDAIKEIEDHMKHIDKDYANLTPGCIPRILREQHQVLLSLAAKVSNLHDETQKLVNNSKGGNV